MPRFRVWLTERRSVLVDAGDSVGAVEAAYRAHPLMEIDEVVDVPDGEEAWGAEEVIYAPAVLREV